MSFCCQILTDFYQVNVRITVVIFPDEHLLKQLGFTWFSVNHFLLKSVHLKSDHQDLLRNICFQKLYFHCSSAEEWSSSHIFWGAFISSSLNQHWIALHHMFESFQSHLTKTYYWDLEWWLIFWSFYARICSTVDLQASEFHLLLFISGFTFMHLADAFIQSDLQCIQAILLFYQYVCSLGIEPMTFCAANAMLYHWATGTTEFELNPSKLQS